jgi:hypothetical protein
MRNEKIQLTLTTKVVDNCFKTLASRQVRKQLAKERVSERGKKLARLASGLVFLLANPEFYSHLASCRVVIRTPERDCFKKERERRR